MKDLETLRILTDKRRSCDIIYITLFKELRIDKGRLSPYKGTNFQEFNDSITHPRGSIKFVAMLGEARGIKVIDGKFFMVSVAINS